MEEVTVSGLWDQIDDMRTGYLKSHGWSHTMWRWFWVWHKKAHDREFTCLTDREALTIERALQDSDSCYPPP
jgi:hypothetical protein